jgi:hypothetical protein
MYAHFRSDKLKGRFHVEDVGVGGWIILKMYLKVTAPMDKKYFENGNGNNKQHLASSHEILKKYHFP